MYCSLIKQKKHFTASSSMDNFVFKLCYRWTALLLIAFSFIVSCRLLFGDSFSCVTEDDVLPVDYVNTKCYDDGVYTVPKNSNNNKEGIPAIDPSNENYKRHQSYYPWVNLFFLVHAFSFYLPHLLWRSYEGGYFHRLTGKIKLYEISNLSRQVIGTIGCFGKYVGALIFFEMCNFAISLTLTVWLIQFFHVDFPLGQPLDEIQDIYFPHEAVCELRNFSASGSSVKFKALCQLPLNFLYMKMFLFLRAWYISLTVLCGLVVFYRIVLLFVPRVRFLVMELSAPLTSKAVVRSVLLRMSSSDWFFLRWLQERMTDLDFRELMNTIAEHTGRKHYPLEDSV